MINPILWGADNKTAASVRACFGKRIRQREYRRTMMVLGERT